MPKPPPTFSEITRNFVSGTCENLLRENAPRLACGPCTVQRKRVAVLARVVFGETAARLHRDGGDAVDPHAMLDHVIRRSDRLLGRRLVAGLMQEGEVVGAVVPHRRRARRDGLLERASPPAASSYSTSISSAASFAWSSVSATTSATGSADVAHAVARQQRLRRTEHAASRRGACAADAAAAGRARALGIVAGQDQQHAGRQPSRPACRSTECAHAQCGERST